jgi:hypothetical protein
LLRENRSAIGVVKPKNPMRATLGCWASAGAADAITAPPESAMNARSFVPSPAFVTP